MSEPLRLKTINELLGEHFYIPKYQRGYRWSEQQVNALLDDVWAFANKKTSEDERFYCLQPIAVKPKQWQDDEEDFRGYEVVDGQQRLTTIYIILSYLTKEFLKSDNLIEHYRKPIYTLRYETRPKSAVFLRNIVDDTSNIDFYYILNAYKAVSEWFGKEENIADWNDKSLFLKTLLGKTSDERSVQIIWYEVPEDADSVALFMRLNVGKIPLTNAELIKALFLSSEAFGEEKNLQEVERRKLEISHLWDDMEQRLAEPAFWAFATNVSSGKYATRIELLFDMQANRKTNEKDPLFTFLHFLKMYTGGDKSLWDLWIEIEKYYRTLCEWFRDKSLYHKVGFLVAVGTSLRDLITESLDSEKNAFNAHLEILIGDKMPDDFTSLSYSKASDRAKLEDVLLLFNVEAIRKNKNDAEFYPFATFKSKDWSLEHIHAQNSENLSTTQREPWLTWLNSHGNLIQELIGSSSDKEKTDQLLEFKNELNAINPETLTWEHFKVLSQKIIDFFTSAETEDRNDLHDISNLALLNRVHNSELNNAVFEVKRRKIIEMDMAGEYIPLCTRRVFLKYYNKELSAQHYYFWSYTDREAYMHEIKNELKQYLN